MAAGGGPGGPGYPGGPGGGRGGRPHDPYGDDRRDLRRRSRRSWPQRLVLTAGVVLVILCLLGTGIGSWALVKYNSIDREDLELGQAAKGEPENFLLVAPDYRDDNKTRNADTIMVLRVNPQSDRVALTSFPRDLMVDVADTGERQRINSSFSRGTGDPQNLIDTINLNFGVPIHHYVQVEFDSFAKVVDAVGGVPIWIPHAARDRGSGFYTEAQQACVTLNGEEGLKFVRSRKMEIQVDGEWTQELQSDVNRVERQKIFVRRAMTDALAEVRSDPRRIPQLIDIGVENVTLDADMGIGDIRRLADAFQGFDADELESYALPVLPDPLNPDVTLVLDEAAAEPMLNVFRGLPPGEIRPQLVDVQVQNGTVAGDEAQQREGLANDVSGALAEVGFTMMAPGDADTFHEHTTIEFAPGDEVYAERVARHITSDTAIPMQQNPDLPAGQVRLIAGADFTTVHEAPTPVEAMPAAPGTGDGAAAADESDGGSTSGPTPSEGASPTTTAPPATTTTTTDPYIIGIPPEGKSC